MTADWLLTPVCVTGVPVLIEQACSISHGHAQTNIHTCTHYQYAHTQSQNHGEVFNVINWENKKSINTWSDRSSIDGLDGGISQYLRPSEASTALHWPQPTPEPQGGTWIHRLPTDPSIIMEPPSSSEHTRHFNSNDGISHSVVELTLKSHTEEMEILKFQASLALEDITMAVFLLKYS